MKKLFLSLSVLTLGFTFMSAQGASSLTGKIIALDAGHGGGETGAVGYCGNGGVTVKVLESDVNLAVRAELTSLLTSAGAIAYSIGQLPTRKERVADAESVGSDVLISIHHNGSSNVSADYTQSFVTQRNDKEFAKYIHPRIASALGLTDKGIKNDGYGMTVYGGLPGVLTESYFITDTTAGCDFVNYQVGASNTRVQKEAQSMYNGLLAYFSR